MANFSIFMFLVFLKILISEFFFYEYDMLSKMIFLINQSFTFLQIYFGIVPRNLFLLVADAVLFSKNRFFIYLGLVID